MTTRAASPPGSGCVPISLRRVLDDLCRSRARDPALEAEADELIEDFWKLSRDLDAALTPEVRSDLTALIDHLDSHRDAYGRALVAWIDLIEDVCLTVEADYGDGAGALKLQRVRGVAFQLARRFLDDAPLPDIPRFVRPVVIDLVTRATVSFIIDLVNAPDPDRALWRNARLDKAPPRPLLVRGPTVVRLRARFSARKQSLMERLIAWLLRPPRLPPRLQAKVDVIVQQWDAETDATGKPPVQRVLQDAFDLVTWIGEHGKEMRAGVDALSIVIHWSYEFVDLDREARIDLVKRALARYVEEIGLGGTVFAAVVELIIDLVVDAAVDIFLKRGALAA
ncbi:hypothetical protein [Caulobacter segnis]|uniref:hypothetical protein n=1 Tax=Caulobacter segnis TaxID=88688 RepID=UPI001CC0D16C|nr:hypothetical protein [Caulobacter segnis]UAL12448.1 hypothetical protein K8940_09260 [Caulobacter segnis]